MSDDLVAFLRARQDEKEAKAKAATPGNWYVAGEDILTDSADPHWDGACAANATGPDAEHIALNDPGRVLREVEAKRGDPGRALAWIPGHLPGAVRAADLRGMPRRRLGLGSRKVAVRDSARPRHRLP